MNTTRMAINKAKQTYLASKSASKLKAINLEEDNDDGSFTRDNMK